MYQPSSGTSALAGSRVAVTGPGGFIGGEICRAALQAGARVLALGPMAPPRNPHPALTHIAHRIGSDTALAESLRGCDLLVHAAGQGTPGNIQALHDHTAQAELQTAAIVLEAAARAQLGRLVIVSSGGTVYGSPTTTDPLTEAHRPAPESRYGVIKLQIEEMAHAMDRMGHVSCVIARLSNPYGPGQVNRRGQGLIATVAARASAGLPIEIWGDGTAVRDYLFITDAARGLLAAGGLPGGTVVNVSSGKGLSTRQVVQDVLTAIGAELSITLMPERPAGVASNILCNARLCQATGWYPETSWADGLAQTAGWWATQPAIPPGGQAGVQYNAGALPIPTTD